MEEAPENGKVLSHSAHANGMNECFPPKSLVILPLNSKVCNRGIKILGIGHPVN
jgi:hypothetical protein